MEVEEFCLVVDESGAKGRSTLQEQFTGELGVMAGFLIPGNFLAGVRTDLEEISSRYGSRGKLHVTDLSPEAQGALRQDVFNYLRLRGVRWVYDAIYVQGLYQGTEQVNEITCRGREERKRSTVRVSERECVELLHANLFLGIFMKAVAFLLDQGTKAARIHVVTDRIDGPVLDLLREKVDDFMRVGNKSVSAVTGYDVEKKQKVHAEISFEITEGAEALWDLSGFDYDISIEVSPLTLAADVLANSVNYHLKELQKRSLGAELNHKTSIDGHPLTHLVYGAISGDTWWFSDRFYSHPGANGCADAS